MTQKTGQRYVQVFIEGKEENLPKEDCCLFVAKKNSLKANGLKPMIYTVISKKKWLNEVEYYLLPLPSAPGLTDASNNLKSNKIKVSEVIKALQDMKDAYGDLPVTISIDCKQSGLKEGSEKVFTSEVLFFGYDQFNDQSDEINIRSFPY